MERPQRREGVFRLRETCSNIRGSSRFVKNARTGSTAVCGRGPSRPRNRPGNATAVLSLSRCGDFGSLSADPGQRPSLPPLPYDQVYLHYRRCRLVAG